MEIALRHAFDPDSPYLLPLLRIFTMLPAEDIARCRTLSRSARRFLCNDRLLSHFPIYFSGFIFTPSPTSEFIHYFSLESRRTFTNIHRYLGGGLRIISSHDNLLLATGTRDGRPWRIVNPLTGMEITPPCGFYRRDHVISAAICSKSGSDYKLFFLVTNPQHGTCTVTFSKMTTASGPNFWNIRRRLHGDPLSSFNDVGSGSREIRPGVHARFPSHCFHCVLFPDCNQVLVVSCRSPDHWVFDLSAAGGEYGLCETTARKVHLTWVGGEYVRLWRLDLNVVNVNGSADVVEPRFEFLRRLRIVYFSDFPGLRIEHFELETLYLRYGPYGKFIWPYNIEIEMGGSLIELPFSTGEETRSEDGKWPPVFAYSCYLGNVEYGWENKVLY